MKNKIWSGACAAVLFTGTLTVAAQQPPTAASPAPSPNPPSAPASAQSPAPPPTSTASAGTITVTGCLQPAPAAATGTSGTADAAGTATAGESTFVLTNVKPAVAADAPASASAAPVAPTYQLVANGLALQEHTGKKLELTGTPVEASSATSASSPISSAPKLNVESGKIISPTCAD
jgi:hypothetical protein